MEDSNAPRDEVLAADSEKLRRIFATFDKNGDGVISKEEMMECLDNLGLRIEEEEAVATLENLDANHDGCLDFNEFASFYGSVYNKLEEEVENENGTCYLEEDPELAEAFAVFDQNGDGFITAEELQTVLSSLGLREGASFWECRRMIKNVDRDGDGKVNYAEFTKMMNSKFW